MHTIEQNLERIANALEVIASSSENFNVQKVGDVMSASTKPVVEDTSAAEKAAAEKAAAEKAAAEKAAAEKAAADKAKAEKAKAEKAAADKAEKAAAEKAEAEKAAAETTPATPAASTSEKTKDDVRKALQAYREIEGTAAMLDILKKFNASNLNDLDPSKYDEVCAEVI